MGKPVFKCREKTIKKQVFSNRKTVALTKVMTPYGRTGRPGAWARVFWSTGSTDWMSMLVIVRPLDGNVNLGAGPSGNGGWTRGCIYVYSLDKRGDIKHYDNRHIK